MSQDERLPNLRLVGREEAEEPSQSATPELGEWVLASICCSRALPQRSGRDPLPLFANTGELDTPAVSSGPVDLREPDHVIMLGEEYARELAIMNGITPKESDPTWLRFRQAIVNSVLQDPRAALHFFHYDVPSN